NQTEGRYRDRLVKHLEEAFSNQYNKNKHVEIPIAEEQNWKQESDNRRPHRNSQKASTRNLLLEVLDRLDNLEALQES
ncbi:3967_t:CDS:1, partial [Cetraspora pellucida]